jgi:acetyl esterase/lipase
MNERTTQDPFPAAREVALSLARAALPEPVERAGYRHWREVPFAAVPGYRPLTLDLLVPHVPDRPPLLVYIHGGAWMQGTRLSFHPATEPLRPLEILIEGGFAVAAISYRFSGEARFPAQLHDAKAAIRWLRLRGDEVGVDARSIGVWGVSSGAHLAAMLGVTGSRDDLEGDVGLLGASSSVQAVVCWSAPTDFAAMDQQAPPNATLRHDDADSPESRLIGGSVQALRREAELASPARQVRASPPAFLLVHGTADRLVPSGQSEILAAAIRNAGGQAVLRLLPGVDHVMVDYADQRGLVAEIVNFFGQHVGLQRDAKSAILTDR